jgi:sugar (pentulose or hexulose) kinase
MASTEAGQATLSLVTSGVGPAKQITLIGGGSCSLYWAQMLADTCNRRL